MSRKTFSSGRTMLSLLCSRSFIILFAHSFLIVLGSLIFHRTSAKATKLGTPAQSVSAATNIANDTPIEFVDAEMEILIRLRLGKYVSTPITQGEMASLKEFLIAGANVVNKNNWGDYLSPLSGMTRLTRLAILEFQ